MNTLTINDRHIEVKEFKGKRVVTFRDIDTVHERPDGTAGRNFRSNRKRFIEGEDYFRITADEFRRAFGSMDKRQTNDIILMTETGYLMLVKSFSDDLSWSVQRVLVNSYFNPGRAEAPSANIEWKQYNGYPVVTIRDVAGYVGRSYDAVRHNLFLYCEPGRDYERLDPELIMHFKVQNPACKSVHQGGRKTLTIIYEEGLDRIAGLMGAPETKPVSAVNSVCGTDIQTQYDIETAVRKALVSICGEIISAVNKND